MATYGEGLGSLEEDIFCLEKVKLIYLRDDMRT